MRIKSSVSGKGVHERDEDNNSSPGPGGRGVGGGGGRNPIFVSVQVQCSALKFNYVKMRPSAVCDGLPRRVLSFFLFLFRT